MRIGVLSDSHGSLKMALKAIAQMGSIEALIHAGDLYSDALRLQLSLQLPVYAVSGNCDTSEGPEEVILEENGHKILITHGHLYRAKNSLQPLLYRAKETSADMVVFGHTHIPLHMRENNIVLFNPGSVSCPAPGFHASYGIINLEQDEIFGEISLL